MRFVRALARIAGLILWIILLAPALALLPAAFVDEGPTGSLRVSAFPLALAVFDPFTWESVRNSVAAAGIVAAGSLFVGLFLALLAARWRFWGRAPLVAFALVPMVIPPLFGAIGLRTAFGSSFPRADDLLAPWWDWICWIWVELAVTAPMVALATAGALARIEAGWEDAARLVGAGRWQIIRNLTWPVVRPVAARAVAAAFTWTLVEPGAPLALGLRRTLAFQIVDSALGPAPLPRAAVLALQAVAFAVVGSVLIRWWGGPPGALHDQLPLGRPRRLPWLPAATVFLLASVMLALLVFPAASFGFYGIRALVRLASDATETGWSPTLDVVSRRAVVNSLALGGLVVLLNLTIARALAPFAGRRPRLIRLLSCWPEALPPLAIAVGALALPWLLALLAGAFATHAAPGPLAALARVLDPYASPGLLLLVSIASIRLPLLGRAVVMSRHRGSPALVDSAVLLGAHPRDARRLPARAWVGAPLGALALTFALAASDLTSALLLAPTFEARTAPVTVLLVVDETADGLARATPLAAFAILLNLGALLIAARSRAGPLREWFRAGP